MLFPCNLTSLIFRGTVWPNKIMHTFWDLLCFIEVRYQSIIPISCSVTSQAPRQTYNKTTTKIWVNVQQWLTKCPVWGPNMMNHKCTPQRKYSTISELILQIGLYKTDTGYIYCPVIGGWHPGMIHIYWYNKLISQMLCEQSKMVSLSYHKTIAKQYMESPVGLDIAKG